MNSNARHCATLARFTTIINRMLSMDANHAALRCKNCILNGGFLMLSCLSEMNYVEKRLEVPTNRYFQLHSRREFGFM
jgi:hypothetical protein